jgi:hypothetical protein
MKLRELSKMFSPKYHSFIQVSPYQERELDATLAISHLFLAIASTARAMAMATEMAKGMDGEGNGNAKAVIVDGSGG